MSTPLLGSLVRRIDEASRRTKPRLGTVVAIDSEDGSLTVDCAGDVISGVRWYSHYSPQVGDVIEVLCIGGNSWRVLGKLSKQLGIPSTVTDSIIIEPAVGWGGLFAEDYWSWSVATGGPFGGPPGQGRRWVYGVQEDHAGVWYMPGIAAATAGGLVTSARLRMTRWTPSAEQSQLSPESSLVTPRLYQHAYTSQPSGPPTLVGAIWAPGQVGIGGSVSWELPSGWLTNLLSGTSTGVAVFSSSAADWTRWASVRLELQVQWPLIVD